MEFFPMKPFELQESTSAIPLENLPLPYFLKEKTHLLRTKERAAGKLPCGPHALPDFYSSVLLCITNPIPVYVCVPLFSKACRPNGALVSDVLGQEPTSDSAPS
jgi:hypothetical protein